MGHGDIVSAWVLAVHRLAYANVNQDVIMYEPGSRGWYEESQRRLLAYQDKQQADYLKNLEKEERKRAGPKTLNQFRPQ
jgi:hypothetical protein